MTGARNSMGLYRLCKQDITLRFVSRTSLRFVEKINASSDKFQIRLKLLCVEVVCRSKSTSPTSFGLSPGGKASIKIWLMEANFWNIILPLSLRISSVLTNYLKLQYLYRKMTVRHQHEVSCNMIFHIAITRFIYTSMETICGESGWQWIPE